MGAVQRLEAVDLRVEDVGAAVGFYTDVLGLVELERTGGTAYLGCGLDGNYDLAVAGGEPGLDRVAVRVTAEEFDRHLDALEAGGVETTPRDAPCHVRGVDFALPASGETVGLVVVEDARYHHSGETSAFLDSTAPVSPDRSGIAPDDLDHAVLASPDVRADAEFLTGVLGFRTSDVQVEAGAWRSAFVRYGVHHHDLGLFAGEPADGLHHLAWAATDVSHMTRVADRLAQRGHALDKPFTKHGPGGNVSFYLTGPAGTRIEYATGVSTVAPDAPRGTYERSERKGGSSVWGGH